jgi:S-formylglutathione hydrolase
MAGMTQAMSTPGVWSAGTIGGKLADIYDPPGADRPRFGVLYLHDIGQTTLRDHALITSQLGQMRLACVCPQGGRFWWVDRICPEFDSQLSPEHYLLERVAPFFRERWGLGPRAIGLLGFCMGGQGVLRLAFRHAAVFPVVAAVSSTIEFHEVYGQGSPLDEMYDSKEQCRQDTAAMHIHPSQFPPHLFFCIDPDDPWFRGNDQLHEKLAALGVPHECDLTSRAGGHSWRYFNHVAERVVRFLHAGLDQESRRLL